MGDTKVNGRKLISAVLAAALASSVLLSCGDESEPTSTDAASAAAVGTASVAETTTGRSGAKAELPARDYKGRNFNILTTEVMKFEIWADELTGEVTNDAIYERNSRVMDQFNIKLAYSTLADTNKVVAGFQTAVTAGDDSYQLLANYAYTSHKLIANGLCLDWRGLEYVDLDRPWWNKLSNDEATINDTLYTAVNDFSVSAMLYTFGFFVNIDLAENWKIGIDALYSDVYDGKWTIDRLVSLTKDIYTDVNGDGKHDENDIYGYVSSRVDSADVFQTAFDNPITGKDKDGKLCPTLMTDKIVTALEKVMDLTYNQTGSFSCEVKRREVELFSEGTAVFIPTYFKQAFDKFRFMEDDYAILPYPKWDERQDGYYTNAMDEYSVLIIPSNSPDSEMVGIISEAIAVESYRSVTPAYYDIALKGKYAVDAKTAEMIDLIMNGRRFDLAFMFGTSEQLKKLPYLFREQLANKDVNIASAYEKIADVVKNGCKVIESYYVA